jgi:hypothetical protein
MRIACQIPANVDGMSYHHLGILDAHALILDIVYLPQEQTVPHGKKAKGNKVDHQKPPLLFLLKHPHPRLLPLPPFLCIDHQSCQ